MTVAILLAVLVGGSLLIVGLGLLVGWLAEDADHLPEDHWQEPWQ